MGVFDYLNPYKKKKEESLQAFQKDIGMKSGTPLYGQSKAPTSTFKKTSTAGTASTFLNNKLPTSNVGQNQTYVPYSQKINNIISQAKPNQSPAYDSNGKPNFYTAPKVPSSDSINENKPRTLEQNRDTAQNLANTQYQDYTDYIKGLNDTNTAFLKDQIPNLENRRDNTVNLIKEGVKNVQATADRQKADANLREGQDFRDMAQTKRETDVARQNKFAQLGTLESGGYFGYTGQQSMGDRDFNRAQADRRKVTEDQIAQIDDSLLEVTSNAELQIQSELAKYNDAIAGIENTINLGEQEKKYALKEAYTNLQNKVFEIQQAFNADSAALEKAKYDAELEYQKLFGDDIKAEQQAAQTKQDLMNTLDDLLVRDTGAITGIRNPFKFITGEAQLTGNMADKLIAQLSLDNIAKLKGTGQISDKEQEILRSASTELGRNLSNEDFKRVLTNLKNDLLAEGAVSRAPSAGATQGFAGGNDPLGLGV